MTAETNELGATRSYEFDAVGNLTSLTDRNNRVVEWEYDALDRATAEVWLDAGESEVYRSAYEYDAEGQLLSASDLHSAYTYDYDDLGRVISVSSTGFGANWSSASTYDAVGNRTRVAFTVAGTADFVNDYEFDEFNRVTRIEQTGTPGGNAVDEKRVDFAFDATGFFASIARYADLAGTQKVVTTTFARDAAAQLTSLVHSSAGTPLVSYAYEYDLAGRLTQQISPDGIANYVHDDSGQLTGADHAAQPDETYTYDANGNRIGGGYVVAPNNRILSDGTYSYEYDAEGNRTRRTEIATGDYETYTWDHRNRLVSVEKFSDDGTLLQVVTNTYDVFDRRIAKSVDADGDGPGVAIAEQYVYDGHQIVLVLAGDGSLTNRYLYGPAIDQILADEQFVDGLFARTLWPLADHLGSIRDLADDFGMVVDHRVYSAFGELLSQTDPAILHRFAFTGRDLDRETGLQFHRARFYDPVLGRWLGEDPISFNAGDENLNRYVGNAPLLNFDPDGLRTWSQFWGYSVAYAVGAAPLHEDAVEIDSLGYAAARGAMGGNAGLIDGAADAVSSNVTVGFFTTPDGLKMPVDIEQRENGYDGGYYIGRFLGEAWITVLTMGASQTSRAGKALRVWDTVGNTVSTAQGGYNIYCNGLNFANAFQTVLGSLGLGGNGLGFLRGKGRPVSGTDIDTPPARGGAPEVEAPCSPRRTGDNTPNTRCFPAGTPIECRDGHFPIESLRPGDWVRTYDFALGDWTERQVDVLKTGSYIGKMVRVDLDDGTSFEATFGHPIWVCSGRDLDSRPDLDFADAWADSGKSLPGRWLHADRVEPGDTLYTRHGLRQVVGILARDANEQVYNLTVYDLHYFTVGSAGVLVHNTKDCETGQTGNTPENPESAAPTNTSGRASQAAQGWHAVPGAQKRAVNEAMTEFGTGPDGARQLLDAVRRGERPMPTTFPREALEAYRDSVQAHYQHLLQQGRDFEVMRLRLEIYRIWLGN